MTRSTSGAVRLATGIGDPATNIQLILQDELGVETPPGAMQIQESNGQVRVSLGDRSSDDLPVGEILRWMSAGQSVFAQIVGLLFGHESEEVTRGEFETQLAAVRRGRPRISLPPLENVAAAVRAQLDARSKSGAHIGLIGPSASGKSVLLSDTVLRNTDPEQRTWVDLADPAVGKYGAVADVLTKLGGGLVTVLIDDAQSAPVLAEQILSIVTSLHDEAIQLVVAGWPTAVELVRRFVGDDGLLYTDATDLCRRIVRASGAPGPVAEDILSLAKGNALVAELAAQTFLDKGRAPTVSDLAASVFISMIGAVPLTQLQLRTLRQLACLGMFEIDADAGLLDRDSEKAAEELISHGICRKNASFIYFGHRTVARLLVHHLDRLELVSDRPSPVRLAVSYLRDAGASQIKTTLDRLDLISVAGTEDQFGAAFLAQCWTSLNVLTRHLAHQVREDPTWGDNVASAVFAAEAFAEVGMLEEWRLCARYIRERWNVLEDEVLPTHTTGETNESDDFSTIQQRMIAEDEEDPVEEWVAGANVDVDRFHRTWVLGLLLGFEGRALELDSLRTQHLLRMSALSLEASGSYYPPRVPWVTARVLIGLSSCGQTVQVSEIANRAAQWLRTRPPVGPARIGGIWKSGTGSWNTDLQITALVLLALGRAGVDSSDRIVKSGLQTLRSGRDEWYRPGKEIDAAQALEAALVLGGQWREYESELRSLLQWCQDSRSWRETRALASVTQDESSKVPAVASALIAVIWETVRSELPLLLQGMVGEGDVGADANIEAQLVRAERVLGELRRHIDEEVQRRRQVVSRGNAANQIVATLAEWESRSEIIDELRDEHTRLRSNPDSGELTRLLVRVNELGVIVLGAAFKSLAVERES